MILKTGYIVINRKVLSLLFKLIETLATQRRRGQRPNIANIKLVLYEIAFNTGYADTRGGMVNGLWLTTYKEIAELTGLSIGQVRSALKFLERVTLQDTQQGQELLMLLEIKTLTKNQYNNSTGSEQLEQGHSSKLNRVGIAIKPLFLQALTDTGKSNSTGSNDETQLVNSNRSKNNLVNKSNIGFSAEPVICTLEPPPEPESFVLWDMDDTTTAPEPEPTAEPLPTGYKTGLGALNVKVKNELVQEDTHRSLASSPGPQSANAIEQAPVHVSEPIAETKRTADTKATGQAHLTAQRGGITLEQAKEQYPQLERGVKYLTYLNELGVVFYPTHLDAFNKAIQTHDNKPEPNAHVKPIAQALRRFGRERAKCDTVEQALEQAKQQQVLEYFGSEPEQRQEYAWGGR
jgi:hypothetical protein